MAILKKLALPAALAFSVLGSSASYADDCNRVTFKFTNKWRVGTSPVVIKVKKISIDGSKGAWDENIDNVRLDFNEEHTTRQRRLNKHENGRYADFTVHFDHQRIGSGWDSDTHGPFRMLCQDGEVISFTIMHN